MDAYKVGWRVGGALAGSARAGSQPDEGRKADIKPDRGASHKGEVRAAARFIQGKAIVGKNTLRQGGRGEGAPLVGREPGGLATAAPATREKTQRKLGGCSGSGLRLWIATIAGGECSSGVQKWGRLRGGGGGPAAGPRGADMEKVSSGSGMCRGIKWRTGAS